MDRPNDPLGGNLAHCSMHDVSAEFSQTMLGIYTYRPFVNGEEAKAKMTEILADRALLYLRCTQFNHIGVIVISDSVLNLARAKFWERPYQLVVCKKLRGSAAGTGDLELGDWEVAQELETPGRIQLESDVKTEIPKVLQKLKEDSSGERYVGRAVTLKLAADRKQAY